jgi:hypothetical protein
MPVGGHGGDDAVLDYGPQVVLVDVSAHGVLVALRHRKAWPERADDPLGWPPPFLTLGDIDQLSGMGQVADLGSVALTEAGCFGRLRRMRLTRRTVLSIPGRSAFAGFRFPPEVIVLVVRWYLRLGCPTATWRNCSPSAASTSIT